MLRSPQFLTTKISPFVDAPKRILLLIDELNIQGANLKYLDVGGGLGISYRDEGPPVPGDLAKNLIPLLKGRTLTLILEPGRSLVGNAGILITKTLYLKKGVEKSDPISNITFGREAMQGYKTVQELTFERIRGRIFDGTLRPGQWIRQDALAAALGVSRMPVREALRRLAEMGLVRFHAHRGAQVMHLDTGLVEDLFTVRTVPLSSPAARTGSSSRPRTSS